MNPHKTAERALGQAVEHLQAGHFEPAENLCRRALAKTPDWPAALNVLGVIAFHTGRTEFSVELFQKVVSVEPGNADARLNLGNALKSLARLDEAEAAYRAASTLNPNDPLAQASLAVVLQDVGRLDEAISAFRKALAISPSDANAHFGLGNAFMSRGEANLAAESFRNAIAHGATHAEAPMNLGCALAELGRYDEAEAALRSAIKADPTSAEAYNNLGAVLTRQGKLDEALAALERALALHPDFVEAHNNVGRAQFERGDVERAEAAYRRALAVKPDDVDTLINLAGLGERANRLDIARPAIEAGLRLVPDHPSLNLLAAQCDRREGNLEAAVERLEKIDRTRASARIAIDIGFELGRVHDRLGNSSRAFEHFAEANRASASYPPHRGADKGEFLNLIDRITARLTPEWLGSWNEAPPLTRRAPAFMVGFPRSGTTLTEQILASHPQLCTLDEKPTIDSVLAHVPGYPDSLRGLAPEQIQRLRQIYFNTAETFVDAGEDTLLVDKMPLNIAHIPLIWRIFPGARFILVMRHPYDACLSCFMQDFVINSAMASFHTLPDAATLYAKIMRLWQTSTRVLPLEYHVVRYEELVSDFEPQVRALLEFLGVGWDPAVHAYAEHARGRGRIRSPSYYQVTEPIYQRARDRWRCYAREFEPLESILQPFVEEFGYEL